MKVFLRDLILIMLLIINEILHQIYCTVKM